MHLSTTIMSHGTLELVEPPLIRPWSKKVCYNTDNFQHSSKEIATCVTTRAITSSSQIESIVSQPSCTEAPSKRPKLVQPDISKFFGITHQASPLARKSVTNKKCRINSKQIGKRIKPKSRQMYMVLYSCNFIYFRTTCYDVRNPKDLIFFIRSLAENKMNSGFISVTCYNRCYK